ncbi:fungal fucose-specific lectin protein [Colletotrichum incanum]|uniref:Fungal fucose-specific lectin protein n=1 Tax=Colletotrichum incanum TaxID=1573173 RepID=A0A166LYS3_COLIC|nr:fungal fucose-specific lectin protein [Colletotrichum incanum]OHW98694.1 hypothetical protein CSPAE12_02609 [Colletotrichum incanum]
MTTPNNNAALGYYSGLEVDGRPGHGGGWGADGAAEFRAADQNLPEVHNRDGGLPEVAHPYLHDYSMMQAINPMDGGPPATNQNGGSHETGYYAPKDQYPPEVVTTEMHEQKNLGTICGIRKKVFWILLAVALLIVVGAAVGGGIGGAMSAQNSSQQSSSSSGGSSDSGSGSGSSSGNGNSDSSGDNSGDNNGDSNNSTTSDMDILPSTNLGAINFTDAYGHVNHLVFYQLRSKNLMMSSWNSSTNVWSSAVANRDSNVKEGSPISNSLFWHSNTTRDIRIYYLNDDNQVAGQINANPVYGMTWDKSGVSNTFTASPKSQLLSNGIYSPDSYLSNLVIYQDSGSTLRVLRRTGGKTDWMAVGISTDFGKPAEGTGLSLIPVYTRESTKRMILFYTTESGSLTQLTLTNDNDWSNNTLPTTLETNATITAFSSGYNNTNLVMHVLATQANKAPVLTTYTEGEWSNAGEISTMSGDDRPMKIAANLAGRVYGLVQRSNDKVEIVEWEWIGGTTYNKIGVVDTVS